MGEAVDSNISAAEIMPPNSRFKLDETLVKVLLFYDPNRKMKHRKKSFLKSSQAVIGGDQIGIWVI